MACELPDTIQLFGTVGDSIVDGPGLRYAVFVQGCSHGCPGCHNPGSHDPRGGTKRAIADILAEIDANRLLGGVTLSGGEPFEQCAACLALARAVKARGLSLWVFSGYRYEDLAAGRPDTCAPELLACCDVLVDGPFVEALSSYDLRWKGSSNQRVIDLPRTREAGEIVLWRDDESFPEPPASW